MKIEKFFKLWIGSLNSDGQQFPQYQQNEKSPLSSNHRAKKKTSAYDDIGNPGPVLGQVQKCGRVKAVIGNTASTGLSGHFIIIKFIV